MIKIFGTGTMRSGGALVGNIISLSQKSKVFTELIYFNRHIYKKNINFKDTNSLFYLANEISNRLRFRNNIIISPNSFFLNFIKYKVKNFSSLYESLATTFLDNLSMQKPKTFVEYENGEWRFINDFLKLNKNYRAIHVIRDPRAIIASFKKLTFLKGYNYFYLIFNWLDSFNYYKIYKKKFNSSRYLFLKFEDIHCHPQKNIKKILNFCDLKFKRKYLDLNYWKKILNEKQNYVNFSAYNMEKQYGFDVSRSNKWKNNLQDWEISLIQNLLKRPMLKLGYKMIKIKNDEQQYKIGLNNLKKIKLFKKRLYNLIHFKKGTHLRINNPASAENWSSFYNPKQKFVNDDSYKIYLYNEKINKTVRDKINIKKR